MGLLLQHAGVDAEIKIPSDEERSDLITVYDKHLNQYCTPVPGVAALNIACISQNLEMITLPLKH